MEGGRATGAPRPAAITREVSPAMTRCELTHLSRRSIDVERAVQQHRAYEQALESLGVVLRRLPASPELPDSVFVEDTAVVLEEVVVLARPGAPSRRPEVAEVAAALPDDRPRRAIEEPGTLDGGDVLRVGRTVLIGASDRTNYAGFAQLAGTLEPLGYRVRRVPLRRCLHLKTAVNEVAEGLLLLNPEWLEPDAVEELSAWDRVEVDPDEPFAATALRIGDTVLHPEAFPRTRARLEAEGLQVHPVEVSELAKAEGGVTCSCLLVPRSRTEQSSSLGS